MIRRLSNNRLLIDKVPVVMLGCLMLWMASAARAEVTVQANLESTVLQIGQTYNLSVAVKTTGGESAQTPVIPELDWVVLNFRGSQSEQSFSMSGTGPARIESTIQYMYLVTPLKEGTYSLSGIKVSSSIGEREAPAIAVTVTAASQVPAPDPGGSVAQSLPAQKPGNPAGYSLIGNTNKKEVYVGEETLLTYQLYFPLRTQIQIQQIQDNKGQFQGFWTETPEMDPNRKTEEVRLPNGQMYSKATLLRYILYPLTAGEHTIQPLSIRCTVPVNRGNGLWFPFGNREVNISADANTLRVLPLPEEGKPDIFAGAVGSFTLDAKVEPREVKEGDNVTLKITLAGLGNLKNAPKPLLPDLSKFDQYDPIKKENIQVTLEGVRGSIEYTHVLMPHDMTANSIGPVRFAYFDPAQKKYVTLETKPIPLTLLPSDRRGSTGITTIGGNRRIIIRLGDDFRFVSTSPLALASVDLSLYHSPLYWVLFLTPLALVATVWLWRRRHDFLRGNPDVAKSRQAPRLARQLLSEARAALKEGKADKVYPHLEKAIINFISNRWNFAGTGMTTLELRSKLTELGVDASVVDQVIHTLEEFDAARFSGSSRPSVEVQDDFSKAEQILSLLMSQKAKA